MTNMEFQNILAEALKKNYDSIPNPEDLSYDYEFSPRFERRMKRMIKNFDRIQSAAQNNFKFYVPKSPLCRL